ncbi:hypothetical protein [Rhodococcus sp. NPDC127528]|uniref:hypothetical protein n=1 Tax=unclassified Rhodococcus (in: high G+C Gram-positive bacteria) TaxID=192944 RepID=UPI0036294577
MAGRLVRAGGMVLAALTIAAGGAVTGVGTAGAAGSGSLEGGSAALGSSAPPCSVDDSMLGCDDGKFHTFDKRVGNFRMSFSGSDEVAIGHNTVLTANFFLGDSRGGQVSLPDGAVESVTFHPPKGFEFQSVKVRSYTPNFYPEDPISTNPDSTAVVDPVTGDVTVTAPTGGWAITKRVSSEGFVYSGQLSVDVGFKATQTVDDGTNGVTFTGTDVPASEGWLQTGTTRVVPDLGPFGS